MPNIAFPFPLQPDRIVGQIYHFDPYQLYNLLEQKWEIALNKNDVGRLNLKRGAACL